MSVLLAADNSFPQKLELHSIKHFPELEKKSIENIHFNAKITLFCCQKYLSLNSNGNQFKTSAVTSLRGGIKCFKFPFPSIFH